MPSTPLKELHVAKSMKDLECLAEIAQNIKKRSTNLLVSSARKVFEAAERYFVDKDEETAYMHYMRFIELALLVQNRSDYKKDNNNHKNLLQCANTALSKAELLKESLSKRFLLGHATEDILFEKINEKCAEL